MSTLDENSEGAEVREVLADALVQSAFEITSVLSEIGAAHDMSLTQLRVLGILRDRRPRVTELAGRLGVEKSSISGFLDRAEQRGLVGREKNADDGRVVDVFLTTAGRELADRLFDEVRTALTPRLRMLHNDQQKQLLELLRPLLTD
ncbi:MarR family winged helix-turn-helix transcriptional regulator [Microbacterium sp.]|uniref:MarR family winged helix-turn-helix transcriptional regulator n=1 Tax=Microbacterium sp. TaxID=51671 RepID=UPI003A8DA060